MQWSFVMIILAIPTLLNVLAIVFYRGTFRKAAVLVLPLTVLAGAADIYSASQRGNLTGIISFLVAGPALILLGLLGIGSVVSRSLPGSSPAADLTGATDDPGALKKLNGVSAWGVVRMQAMWGALFGASACGLIFGCYYGAWGADTPGRVAIGLRASLIGAVIGAVGWPSLARLRVW